MNKFDPKVLNRLIYSKRNIVTEVPPLNKGNRKWISIYNIDRADYRFRIFEIELPASVVENDWDWGPAQEISREIFIRSEQELYSWLNERSISLSSFGTPWSCQYPYH